MDEYIEITGAAENNLKNISVRIPKKKITIVTGVSGSGKSSLVLDTIAAKSRRELNDTFPSFVQQYLPKYGRPHVENITDLPIAIVIDQRKPAVNSRSTVGTYTDIYSLLRLLFSRIGTPFIGYSDTFSFNHPQGSCPRCAGLGEIRELDIHKLVDFDKSLNDEDTIHYIAFHKGGWRWIRYAHSGLFDLDKKIKDYTPEELDLFLDSPQIKLKDPPSNWPRTAKYEGLIPRMYRSIINSEEGLLHSSVLNPMLTMGTCPDCHGTRLNPKVLSCKIDGVNIAQACAMSISQINNWVATISNPLAADMRAAISGRLSALEEIGLGYLTLDRPVGTLSGGEAQRCKIAKYINSSLSDVMYILDEPSVGLHNHDIHLLKDSVRKLRDHNNTVILVEHHREMIQIADHIIDMGPEAGVEGGHILFEGSYAELLKSGTSTGKMIEQRLPIKSSPRTPSGWFSLEHATLHNLSDVSVQMPLGVFGVIAGVAGSGKSSLMECFRQSYPTPDDIVYISQKNIGISLRSTPATYMNVSDDIRKVFAKQNHTKVDLFSFNGKGACPTCGGKGVIVSDMAFMDSIETVCEACGGLRYSQEALQYTIPSTLHSFHHDSMADASIETSSDCHCPSAAVPLEATSDCHCPSATVPLEASSDCHCPSAAVPLEATHFIFPARINIAQVMNLTVRKASELFAGTIIEDKLKPLMDVGLMYLHLNQALSTLSGGELQRLKLASYLSDRKKIFILDEPTDGLHIKDIRNIISLFDHMVSAGNTVYLIEHNLEVLKSSDYVIELGPAGGAAGGHILFTGTPTAILTCHDSITARYLNT